jgi:hypothetical protein
MQGRSWMAALTLVAGLIPVSALATTTQAEDKPATSASTGTSAGANADGGATASEEASAGKKAAFGTQVHKVKLELRIAGLGPKGCDVEIKPGHAGCRFETKTRHVDAHGWATILLNDIQTQSADRDCTFAITIREPGQAERTVRRGLRLGATPGPGEMLLCYLSSPSKLAKAGEPATPKR